MPVLIFSLCQTAFILIPFYTHNINVASEYGLTHNEIQMMVLVATLCECIFRPIAGIASQKIGITRLAIVWSLVFLLQASLACTAKTASEFRLEK